MCESKWITETLPQRSKVPLSAARVVVWSPPSVMMRGTNDFEVVLAVLPEITSAKRQMQGSFRALRPNHILEVCALCHPTYFMCLFKLFQSNCIVKEGQGCISTIYDLCPALENVLSYSHSASRALFFNTRLSSVAQSSPVYTLQPARAAILLEPCRMPPGPNRAPGLAVTP